METKSIWLKKSPQITFLFHFEVVVHIFTFPFCYWIYSKHRKGEEFSFSKCHFSPKKSIQVSIKRWQSYILPESSQRREVTGPCQPFCNEIQTDETSPPQSSREELRLQTCQMQSKHVIVREGLCVPHQSTVRECRTTGCRTLLWAPVNTGTSLLTRGGTLRSFRPKERYEGTLK